MTQVFKREVDGSATHAFVIGVGSYPSAKPGQGVKTDLRTVQDLASAADSAKLMCDWLITNQDQLAAPLGSLEVLIADPAKNQDRYEWVNQAAVAEPTSWNVYQAGLNWVTELKRRHGDVALFYACGHGAGFATQPVIFLSDLNADEVEPWSYHNIGVTAASFRHIEQLRAAFFFTDTCREFIPGFELSKAQDKSRFINADTSGAFGIDKVSLLCAASEKLLAYEGHLPESEVRIGRFTQTLIKGLDGASARWESGKWMVHPSGLIQDMKRLQRVYRPDWSGDIFEPSLSLIQNDVYPIVIHKAPRLPVLVRTEPEDAMDKFDLRICTSGNGQTPWIDNRQKRSIDAWLAHVQAGLLPLYAVAQDPLACHSSLFLPVGPNFDQRIPIL